MGVADVDEGDAAITGTAGNHVHVVQVPLHIDDCAFVRVEVEHLKQGIISGSIMQMTCVRRANAAIRRKHEQIVTVVWSSSAHTRTLRCCAAATCNSAVRTCDVDCVFFGLRGGAYVMRRASDGDSAGGSVGI